MDDREVTGLVERVLEGDRNSFHPIVEEFTPPLYNLARKMVGSAEEAQDVVQETFFRAYRDLGRYDPSTRFFSWLYGICVHVGYDALKRRRREAGRKDPLEGMEDRLPDGGSDAHAAYESRQREERLRACLLKLPESQRSALILRYQLDLSLEEVAQVLGVGLSAAKMRIQRGLGALREHCGDFGPRGET